jgi:recombination protein RecA
VSFMDALGSIGGNAPALPMSAAKLQPAKPALVKAPTLKEMKDKLKALDEVAKELNVKFDTTNSLVRLGDKIGKPMPSLETNLPTLDWGVFQTGGVPRGRLIEIYGPESSGKTTIALHVIAEAQKRGELAAFIDAEHALDPNYARVLGVDVDNLVVAQPDNGEQAVETAIALVDSGAVSLVVIDSVAALVPQAELDGDVGDSHMGLQARLMSQSCRMLVGRCRVNNVTVIFINQIREKIGVMMGNPETTTGGRALKFFASVRLDVRKKYDANAAKSGAREQGHVIKIKAVKNKVGCPFKETEVYLDYENGLDTFGDFVAYCKDQGVIEGSSWLKFEGENIGNGLDKTKEVLRGNPTLVAKIKAALAKVRAVAAEVKA